MNNIIPLFAALCRAFGVGVAFKVKVLLAELRVLTLSPRERLDALLLEVPHDKWGRPFVDPKGHLVVGLYFAPAPWASGKPIVVQTHMRRYRISAEELKARGWGEHDPKPDGTGRWAYRRGTCPEYRAQYLAREIGSLIVALRMAEALGYLNVSWTVSDGGALEYGVGPSTRTEILSERQLWQHITDREDDETNERGYYFLNKKRHRDVEQPWTNWLQDLERQEEAMSLKDHPGYGGVVKPLQKPSMEAYKTMARIAYSLGWDIYQHELGDDGTFLFLEREELNRKGELETVRVCVRKSTPKGAKIWAIDALPPEAHSGTILDGKTAKYVTFNPCRTVEQAQRLNEAHMADRAMWREMNGWGQDILASKTAVLRRDPRFKMEIEGIARGAIESEMIDGIIFERRGIETDHKPWQNLGRPTFCGRCTGKYAKGTLQGDLGNYGGNVLIEKARKKGKYDVVVSTRKVPVGQRGVACVCCGQESWTIRARVFISREHFEDRNNSYIMTHVLGRVDWAAGVQGPQPTKAKRGVRTTFSPVRLDPRCTHLSFIVHGALVDRLIERLGVNHHIAGVYGDVKRSDAWNDIEVDWSAGVHGPQPDDRAKRLKALRKSMLTPITTGVRKQITVDKSERKRYWSKPRELATHDQGEPKKVPYRLPPMS